MATQITTALQPLNPFPHRLTVTEDEMVTQGEAFFDQLQQDFQPELSDIIDEMNAVATEVNTNAINTENNAILANGLANFKGAWSGVTTYGKGESVESTPGSQIYYISKVAGNLNHVVTDTNYWLYSPINDKLDKDTVVLTAKTSLVDEDVVLMGDSASSNTTKKITWANLKATLETYFDILYIALAGDQDIAGIKNFLSSPLVPTQTPQDNSTKVATTAYVDGKFVRGTAVATISGNAVDFTAIPSWAKKITIMFNGVSLSGTSNLLVQLGSTTIQNTGYISSGSAIASGNNTNVSSSTLGFIIYENNSINSCTGIMNILNISGNTYVSNHSNANTTTVVGVGGGSVTLSGRLDRIRITSSNGTDTFDAGSINIIYEG